MDLFCDISPDEMVLLASAIAVAISKDLDSGELNTLGNFIMTIGQNLSTIAGQKEFLENCK